MDVDCHGDGGESKNGWTKLEFDADEAALSDLGLGALDISFETRRAGDGSGRVRVRVHSSSQQQQQHHLLERQNQIQKNHLSLPNREELESDEESEDLGPFLTSTPSSASRSSSQSQSIMDGLNLGFGLNSLNNYNYNSFINFGMDSVGMSMGIDNVGSLGMGGFSMPDYGLDSDVASAHSHGSTRRRVRIALARLPHAGGEGGEWDVVEVAA